MKILSIISQKPYSTGSGVYLVETLKSLSKLGHENVVVYGCYENEKFSFNCDVKEYKVVFSTKENSMKIFGMSDTMPYESSKYKDMTDDIFEKWSRNFLNTIDKAISEDKPDIIICHHLYLLTALVKEKYRDMKVYGICHNTDLRQFIKTDFKREFLKDNISSLDRIFSPTEYHKNLLCELYGCSKDKVDVIGIGYNREIFTNNNISEENNRTKLLYVGKVTRKKGVSVLLNALKLIDDEIPKLNKNISLDIVGGSGDNRELKEIFELANSIKNITINFLGRKNQNELAFLYNHTSYFILPSFFDAVPLTLVEAVACGAKVIVSSLPGLKDYMDNNIKNSYIRYVDMPKMYNADETTEIEIMKYEERLSKIILEEINKDKNDTISPNLSLISWENIARKFVKRY